MTSAADLLALQDIDLKRDSRRALIADIESRLGETEELIDAREDLEDARYGLEALQKEQRSLDDKLKDLEAKIGPLDTKLYDGSVRNPKELTDLQKELDMFKAQRGQLDEAGVALIERVDAASQHVREAEKTLQETEAAWKAEQIELETARARAERESGALEAERLKWTVNFTPTTLGLYEQLRVKRQGRAVARVERTTCQGCRLNLPTQIVQRVRAGAQLVQCPSCERILVGN